jgi:hypothetical protein
MYHVTNLLIAVKLVLCLLSYYGQDQGHLFLDVWIYEIVVTVLFSRCYRTRGVVKFVRHMQGKDTVRCYIVGSLLISPSGSLMEDQC